ncbi:MAG: SsrA-binding protein SmpB, partial [Gemmatimonadales bacterium]
FRNRKAFHEYHFEERVEAGLVLTGTEVKSLRDGKCTLDEAYARLTDDEVFLVGMDVAQYPQAVGVLQHDPKRTRKCLLKKRQIAQLIKLTAQKGMTIIPLAIYFNHGYAKVELGIGRGKVQRDKRRDLKDRQAKRDIDRVMRRGR